MKKICPLVWALAAVAIFSVAALGGETAPVSLQVKSSVSRDYGYFMGDLVEVVYVVSLPPGYDINESSLSNQAPGDGPSSCEIRSRIFEHTRRGKDHWVRLGFVYQVFSAGDGVQPFEIPAVRFNYGLRDKPAGRESSLPPVPIMISSLAPDGAMFQPPMLWSWASPSPMNIRLVGFALLLAGVLPFFFWKRKTFRAYSPFKAAREKIAREKDPAAALILFRKALNEKAGKAVFPHNLDDFFGAFPPAKTYEKEVEEMVRLSDEVVFNPRTTAAGPDLQGRVLGLTGKLRKAEKWR